MEYDLEALGLGQYLAFRPVQMEALRKLHESSHRLDVAALTTRVGKSQMAVA